MTRTAHFKVSGQLDRGTPGKGTVTIEARGDDGIVTVRPHRGRRVYALALSEVAAIVVARAVKRELRG